MTVGAPSVLADRYDVGALLGAGGMAHVYRAEDRVLGRPVAVKVFRADVEGGELARIQQETTTLARLNHPGLVAVYDAGGFTDAGGTATPYLVMELVEGPTWEQCCMDGSLGAAEVASTGAELADTLAYVHAQGVVHRDVKPANVLLAAGGRPKLADFGIALLADAARHTQTGLTIGTAPYLSPEQVLGAPVGPPADVYALGLVLLEALTGRREFTGSGTETALARLHRQPDVPVSAPPALREALTAMVAREPGDRPTAEQAAALLRRAAGQAPATRVLAPATTVQPAADGPASRHVVLDRRDSPGVLREVLRETAGSRGARAVAVVLGALGLLVLALVLLLSGDDPAPSAPATPPSPPAQEQSRLEQDLTELREAVTP